MFYMCMGPGLWVHMCVHARGASELMLEIIFDCSDTLCTETGSSIRLLSVAGLLWGPLTLTS